MKQRYKWDINAARAAGFEISNQQMTPGIVPRFSGIKQIADKLSDLLWLSRHSEVCLEGKKPGKQIYIKTGKLISSPQLIVGYQPTGHVALLSALEATNGHYLICGPTGGGKSTYMALIIYQLIRLGFFVMFVGMKSIDRIVLASMRAAASSTVRFDKHGNPVNAKCHLVTLQPNIPSRKICGLLPSLSQNPLPICVAQTLMATGQMGGPADPSRRFFNSSGQNLLLKVTDWAETLQQLDHRINKLKLDRDTLYNTAGLRQEISQLASLEVANGAPSDPASINLAEAIRNRDAIYIDGGCQFAGEIGISFVGLILNAFVVYKKIVDPLDQEPAFVTQDECQMVFHPHLKLLVEQTRSSNTRLGLAFHSPSQFGDAWESICMARTRIITGAVPGGFLDQVMLPRAFGKQKVYRMSFGQSQGTSSSTTTTHSTGGNVSFGISVGDSTTKNFGFTEADDWVFGPNETAELNYSPNAFMLQVSPGCDLAYFGSRPIICERGELHLSRDEVQMNCDTAIEDTRAAVHIGFTPQRTLTEFSDSVAVKRRTLLSILNKTADAIRQNRKLTWNC